MGWTPNHGRIKPRYNPVPNAQEARHEERVKALPCFGCGRFGVSAHHTMLEFPAKRWRRDHRYQLPLCWDCHQGPQGVHGIGSEEAFLERVGKTPEEAIAYVIWLWEQSEAEEARRAA